MILASIIIYICGFIAVFSQLERTLQAQPVLKGTVLVPKEPTEEMISVAYSKKHTAWQNGHSNCELYHAMIAAAQKGE